VFWVISVYFNIRNTLPKFCPFLLGHPVYVPLVMKGLKCLNSYADYKYAPRDMFVFVKLKAVRVN